MTDISETDRIEHDLAQTRARMDRRLDELQDHLTPKQMLNDAFAYVRGGEGSDFTNDLIRRAKANPIPVALAGIGIVWLMASGTQAPAGAKPARRVRGENDMAQRLRLAEGKVVRYSGDDEDSYARRLDDARGQVLGLARSTADTAQSYAQKIKDAIASHAHGLADQARDLASATSGRSADNQEGSSTMPQSTRETLSSAATNPFALGALAAVIGAVAGSLIPSSDKEENALGPVATKLKTAGRDLAQDVVDRGGRIAGDTLAAVKNSADAHGLGTDRPVGQVLSDVKSGDLLGNVKQVAQEGLQAGKDAAQTHLASAPQSQDDKRQG